MISSAKVHRAFGSHVYAMYLLLCLTATVVQAVAQGNEPGGARFPESELGKLPYVYFSANNLAEANIFRMEQENRTIEVGGQSYIGFQFWSTGLVEWLFITTPGDLQPGNWLLVNQQGEQVDAIEPKDVPLADCPRVPARYPQAIRVTRYKTSGESLETRGRYHLLQKVGSGKPAPYAISLASCSPKSYEAGRSGDLIRRINDPVIRPSSDVVIENMIALRREEGVEAATAYLSREMELRMDDSENLSTFPENQRLEAARGFNGLYTNAWYEGQLGGGRLDEGWASEVYGVMYGLCLKRGYFARIDVATNLTSSLNSAGRYGKLAEVMESWKEGMRLGGYRMDTGSYPDLGPAFGVLPQVRKRDIPHLAPFSKEAEHGIKVRNHFNSLSTNLVSCMENYAHHLWYQGDWHDSLEWLVWANRWAGDQGNLGPGSPGKGYVWHGSLSGIANFLASLGFSEEALTLHQDALKQEITGGYEGKYTVDHQMACLELPMRMGRALPGDCIEQARSYIARAAGNIYEQKGNIQAHEALLGELLIHLGRTSEGEELLDQLSAAGSRAARIARLKHWVGSGRTEGVEAELLQLLEQSRETGRKMDEIVFYRLYADFLEGQGRLGEALWVRRELVRLCQAFDLFTHLPLEMAKLAALLSRTGNSSESLLLAEQAGKLLAVGGIPLHLAQEAQGILAGIAPGKQAEEKTDPALRVEFQPLQSIIIPLKGASWVSHLTLVNPSDTDQSGTLQATGLPIRFREADGEADILATLGALEGEQKLKVKIAPANYRIIALHAADDFTGIGEFSLSWTADDGEYQTASHIRLEEAIGGATKAIIQAGAYQLNPFYGIPVYHHYVDSESSEFSRPMRFVSSQHARIEIYGMDGAPIAIDGQGNGSLRNPGDELFGTGDDHGNLLLPLDAGSTSFRIVIYPQKELPEEGLSLRIECLEGSQWEIYAEDHLTNRPAGN